MSAGHPLGVGSLAANVVAHGALLVAALAQQEHDGASAAQAQRIGTRAGLLSVSNDAAFEHATRQLRAPNDEAADGFWLGVALVDAASTPHLICEAACDLALLTASLAERGDATHSTDYAGISVIAAAAATSAAALVRTNLAVRPDDPSLVESDGAAAEAALAAQRAAALFA